jgi:lipid-binding SYLF domain-containing protein
LFIYAVYDDSLLSGKIEYSISPVLVMPILLTGTKLFSARLRIGGNKMKHISLILALCACLVMPQTALAGSASTPAEQRAGIQKMADETLARLYREQPDAAREIEGAVGFAVFSSGALALVWVSGGYGHGLAHDNRNNSDVYMQMASAGVGLGLGAKDYNTVFVFHDPAAFYDFTTEGLDLTGTADAAAKIGMKGDEIGGAENALPGVRIYQLTDAGLIAQAMVQGTKYWRDRELNK